MSVLPRLLETYEEARLLFEAKGWGLAKTAEHLSEMPELARFHISHAKLSVKTKPGAYNAIEPEVAAAVEGMQTWRGHERQTEIVTKGLLALHGDPSIVDVDQLTADLRERLPASELAPKLVEALERKAGRRAPKLGRAFWSRIAIAGSGALVGCLAVLVAPLLAGAAQPSPLVLMVYGPAADDAPVRFDPRSLFDNMPAAWGEKPLDQPIPKFTLPGQKTAPCNEALAEEAINGNCWIGAARVKPPCGLLFRQGDTCYRPVAAEAKKPATP